MPRDGLALLLGDEGHDADGEVVGLGHVGGEEAHAAVAKGEEKCGVAGEPVELGDGERHAGDPCEVERPGQLRPVGALAALHLGEGGDDLRAAIPISRKA